MQYRIDKNSKENQKKQLHKNIINNTNKIPVFYIIILIN